MTRNRQKVGCGEHLRLVFCLFVGFTVISSIDDWGILKPWETTGGWWYALANYQVFGHLRRDVSCQLVALRTWRAVETMTVPRPQRGN
jgi:hypothetical protein